MGKVSYPIERKKSFAAAMRAKREELGLNPTKAAKLLRVSPRILYDYENGVSAPEAPIRKIIREQYGFDPLRLLDPKEFETQRTALLKLVEDVSVVVEEAERDLPPRESKPERQRRGKRSTRGRSS